MERGFGEAAKFCGSFEGNLTELFEGLAEAMMSTMGGAIGPIYGVFWEGAAESYTSRGGVSGEGLARAFESGCLAAMSLGKVSPGDKTVIDAMFPCKEAMLKEKNCSAQRVLEAGAAASRMGAEATKEMEAKRGRARFMGEKSKGYIDAGAVSFSIFMEALAGEFGGGEKEHGDEKDSR